MYERLITAEPLAHCFGHQGKTKIHLRAEKELNAGLPGAVVPGDAVEGIVGEGERRLVEAGERGRTPAAASAATAAPGAAVVVTIGVVVAPILTAAANRNNVECFERRWKCKTEILFLALRSMTNNPRKSRFDFISIGTELPTTLHTTNADLRS